MLYYRVKGVVSLTESWTNTSIIILKSAFVLNIHNSSVEIHILGMSGLEAVTSIIF